MKPGTPRFRNPVISAAKQCLRATPAAIAIEVVRSNLGELDAFSTPRNVGEMHSAGYNSLAIPSPPASSSHSASS
jgi:hypothetical protein